MIIHKSEGSYCCTIMIIHKSEGRADLRSKDRLELLPIVLNFIFNTEQQCIHLRTQQKNIQYNYTFTCTSQIYCVIVIIIYSTCMSYLLYRQGTRAGVGVKNLAVRLCMVSLAWISFLLS